MISLILGCLIFAVLVATLNRIFNKNQLSDPYECGFYGKESSSLQTSGAF